MKYQYTEKDNKIYLGATATIEHDSLLNMTTLLVKNNLGEICGGYVRKTNSKNIEIEDAERILNRTLKRENETESM